MDKKEKINEIFKNDKKVGILTFHHAINPGAYLQCFALIKIISNLGYDVEIINYKNFKHLINQYKGFFLTKDIKLLFSNIIKIIKFKKAQKQLVKSRSTFSKRCVSRKYYNTVVIGSDIVWDFKNLSFGLDTIYFGYFLNTRKLISYAASFGAIKENEVIPNCIRVGLRKFNKISVRDINSLKIIKRLGISGAKIVLDPVFLYDFTKHEIDCRKSNFILVYAYLINVKQIAELKKFAMKNGFRIIAITYKQSWCDENIIAVSPFEWLGYFRKAKYIVTSTFHGTIFSIKYKKSFITISNIYINNKTKYILDLLGLESRIWYENIKLDDIITKKIEYDKIYFKLNKFIKNSLKFLQESLTN